MLWRVFPMIEALASEIAKMKKAETAIAGLHKLKTKQAARNVQLRPERLLPSISLLRIILPKILTKN